VKESPNTNLLTFRWNPTYSGSKSHGTTTIQFRINIESISLQYGLGTVAVT